MRTGARAAQSRASAAASQQSERLQGRKSFTQPVTACKQQIDYGTYHLSFQEVLLALGKGAAVSALFAYIFYRSMLAFGFMLPLCCGILIWRERRQRLKRRKRMLAQQFKEAMVILAASLSAGYAVENAMAVSLEDVQNLAEVLGIGKRTGGDLGSIMRHTAEVIRDKMQVKEEIITLTTSRQFEQKIMNMIPFFIIVYVEGSSPGFFDQMYCTGMGRVLMTMCLILYLTAFWLSERILDIEV